MILFAEIAVAIRHDHVCQMLFSIRRDQRRYSPTGAKCAAGDPIDVANPIMQLAYRGSFDPRDDETSRVVAAGAVVGALRHPAAVEFSLSSAKSEVPPTEDQWTRMLNEL